MEIVAALFKRKLASIDVIGRERYPFEIVLGETVGAGLMKVIIGRFWMTCADDGCSVL